MVSDSRLKRLEDNVARLAAEILHTELKQPLPGVVTITGARMAKDLSRARIWYTALGSDAERAALARRLRNVSSFVQREVARRMHLRVTPALTFEFDRSAEQGAEVLRLLAELKNKDGDKARDSE
jgi:ribosome-binding factor A